MNVVINLGVAADLNTLKNVGVYQVQNPVHGPSAGSFFIHVTATSVNGYNMAVQKAWDLDTGTEYRRIKSNAGWQSWVDIGSGGGGGGGPYDPEGTADAVMADHLAATDPHPQYINEARGDVRYDANGAAATAVSNHVAATDPHTQYLNVARADVLYDELGAADAAVAAHVADTDPHTQYLTNARGDARYDKTGANYRDFAEISTPSAPAADTLRLYAVDEGGVTRLLQKKPDNTTEYVGKYAADVAISTHVAASDPHPQYLNTTRGDARYDARYDVINAASTAISNHLAASDPHPQYLNNSRGDARYDAAGTSDAAIASLSTVYQPLDSDLTAIAGLSTQSYGRSLLTYASEAALKAYLNLEANIDFYAPGGTDVAITDGGTGASTQAAARQAMSSPHAPGYRITLTSGDPMSDTQVPSTTAATTVYYTPYLHSYVPLKIGGLWLMYDLTGTELSQALSDTTKSPSAATASHNYDKFLWYDSGTVRFTRGPAWSSDTVRGTGAGTTELEWQNGRLVNKYDITNGPAAGAGLYVGSIKTTATNILLFTPRGAGSGGYDPRIFIWNMYNRIPVHFENATTDGNHTYASATTRQLGGSAGYKASFLKGFEGDTVNVVFSLSSQGDGSVTRAFIGLAVDSTTAFDIDTFGQSTSLVYAKVGHSACGGSVDVGLGYHQIIQLQKVVGGTGVCTFYPRDGNMNGSTMF